MSRKIKPLTNIIYRNQFISEEDLKTSLLLANDEALTDFLFNHLMEKTKNIDIESRGFSSYRKNMHIIFIHLKKLIIDQKYYKRKITNHKLSKVINIIEGKINTYNEYHEKETHLLDTLLKECYECKDLLYAESKKIISKPTIKTIEPSFPNIIIPDKETLQEMLSLQKNHRDDLVDLTDRYTFSIDSDRTHYIDDALSIEKLTNGNYLIGTYITNVGESIPIGSKKDKAALNKNIKGERMFSPDITDSYSLYPKIPRKVIACMLILDKDGNIVDKNSVKFVKAKIQVDKQLHFNDIPDILHKNDYSDIELRKKIEMLSNITYNLYQQRRKTHILWNNVNQTEVPFKKTSNDDKHVASRIVGELMILTGSLAASYADERKYPFLHFINSSDIENNLNFFHSLDIFNNTNSSKEDLIKAKYYLANQNTSPINSISHGRVSSPLWRYPDLANQRAILKCFIEEHPQDNDIYVVEENLRRTADLFNSLEPKESAKQKVIKRNYAVSPSMTSCNR